MSVIALQRINLAAGQNRPVADCRYCSTFAHVMNEEKPENGAVPSTRLLRAARQVHMKKWFIAGISAAGLLMSSAAMARVDIGVSIGLPGVIYPAPVYVAPQPVYVEPRPVYYDPPVVYREPRYVRPAPVYYYGEGHRHWRGKHGHKWKGHGRGHRHRHYDD